MHPSVMWNVCACVVCGELCYMCVCMGVCVSITSTDAYYNGSANAVFILYLALLLFFLDTILL